MGLGVSDQCIYPAGDYTLDIRRYVAHAALFTGGYIEKGNLLRLAHLVSGQRIGIGRQVAPAPVLFTIPDKLFILCVQKPGVSSPHRNGVQFR